MQASIARHENYFLYRLFFRKFTSKKMILQLPIQLSMWCTSLCELINNNQKQSNLSLTMLKSIGLSGNEFFAKPCQKKIVCSSDLNSTFGTNAWAILKTLFDNLRSNSLLSRKTKTKLRKLHIFSGSLWERSLSEIGFPKFTKKMEFKLSSNKEIKNFAAI